MTLKPDSCKDCQGWQWGQSGFMPTYAGTGTTGVLLVGEALGETEAATGVPFSGKAGTMLTQLLQRLDLKREDFWIDNCLRCRPPQNKLNGEWYEEMVLESCKGFLDATIDTLNPRVIVTLGEIPMQRVLGLGKDAKITPHRGYVEWSEKYHCWVIPTYHPSYLMRGNQHLSGVWLNDVQKAVDIARDGFSYHRAMYHVDPTPAETLSWVIRYEAALADNPDLLLSYDIETPMKARGDEDELEDDPSFEILRIGFAFSGEEALSIPYSGEYLHLIRRLLGSPGRKASWNGTYDRSRLTYNGVSVEGEEWDGMLAWHILQSALPKGLGFVASMLAPDQKRWKHLSSEAPGVYNACDAAVTFRLLTRIKQELESAGLWQVFYQHVVRLDTVLGRMSAAGMPVDPHRREAAKVDLSAKLETIRATMEGVVPVAAKRAKVYRKFKEGAVEIEIEGKHKVCARCGQAGVLKPHVAKKTLDKQRTPNPCYGSDIVIQPTYVKAWETREPFVPSKVQMLSYQAVVKHQAVASKKDRTKVSFDESSIGDLIRKYPTDPLYPLVLKYRETEKLLSTYVEGLLVGPDNRVHTQYVHNPSTLRLASRAPNMQNIPRGNGAGAIIKTFFVAEPGHVVYESDFRAIEAQLVGYFAGDPTYIRLAKLGVHDYLNSHILARAGKIPSPADLAWSNHDLKAFFKDLKGRFGLERDVAKRVVHMSNYGGTPRRMVDANPETFPTVKMARDLQDLYFEVCPGVKRWQNHTVALAAKQAYLRNPFGYLHRFWNVLSWKRERDGQWHSSWGEDAKKALAFLPQSTAAGIIKDAMLEIDRQDLSQYLRLQVHDSLVGMVPVQAPEVWDRVVSIMSMPSPALPLDPAWGLGTHLSIEVETKSGPSWGEAKE